MSGPTLDLTQCDTDHKLTISITVMIAHLNILGIVGYCVSFIFTQ